MKKTLESQRASAKAVRVLDGALTNQRTLSTMAATQLTESLRYAALLDGIDLATMQYDSDSATWTSKPAPAGAAAP